MNVFISKRAQRAAERIAARWRKHADDPSIFPREFLEAIEFLESMANPGSPFPTPRRPGLKRIVTKKSYCHIYFEIDEPKQIIKVLTVWDGRRGRPPKL